MKVLVVVDMQNDFIDGALGTKEAQAIVPNVVKKIEEYNRRGCFIVATMDSHGVNYFETQEGKNLPVEHCIVGTNGWQITDEINIKNFGQIYTKNTFGEINIGDYIREAEQAGPYGELESIELVGLCTDICVISNAMILKAAFPEIPIIVDASCCAGVTPESHKNALEAMKMCQINIINEEV